MGVPWISPFSFMGLMRSCTASRRLH